MLPNGPFPECFRAQHLSEGLRLAERQDYKPSASIPSLPRPNLLQSFPWLTPCSPCLVFLESFVRQDGEGQQEGSTAFAAGRGGLRSTRGCICTVQMPVGGKMGMTCAQLRQKL